MEARDITPQSAILITGANGFVGKNLVAQLRNEGFENLLLFDMDTPKEALAQYAADAQFVFHLAGVNRPKNPSEFYEGNRGLTEQVLALLEAAQNNAPVLMTSSVQAQLDNDYGKSKAEAETAIFAHERKTGAPALILRMPGVFGKWCRPSYNSVVATFCHNVTHGEALEVRDANYKFPLLYIDDLVDTLIKALRGGIMRDCSIPGYCHLGCEVYDVTLGELASTLESFAASRKTLSIPDMKDGFTRKLYATYLSYLPEDAFSYPLDMHCDDRGSFTEFLRTEERGQVSVNISKPGIVKGNHWHNTKNEKFLVVKGSGVIRFRKLNEDKIISYHVNGDKLEVVDIPTGYTHNIENVGEGEMVTVMWASEPFDAEHPDTYFLKV